MLSWRSVILWFLAIQGYGETAATSVPYGAVPSTAELDMQRGCTTAVMRNFTDSPTGDDRHDLDTIRVGIALNWNALSVESQMHIRNSFIFWKEWTTPGSGVSSLMFTMSEKHVKLPVWPDGRPVETIFCALDDFGEVGRAKAIYKEFIDPQNNFHVLLGGIDARINFEVTKVVNNSGIVTFLWAFHRPALYQNGVGLLPSVVAEPSVQSFIDFDNTTNESRVGPFPVIDGARWPENFQAGNFRGVFDLNVQPQHFLSGPLELMQAAGAKSIRAFASPAQFDTCLAAVSNSSLELTGIVNIHDFTLVSRALKIIDTSTVLVLCSYDEALHHTVISSLSTGFSPFAVLFHDTVLVDLALDEILLSAVTYFMEPFPLPPCDWLNQLTIEEDGLSSFSFLTEIYTLRFLEEGTLSAYGFQILTVAELILLAARTIGYVDNYAVMENFLLSPTPRDTTLGPLRFASSGLRDVALTSTRQAFPVTSDEVPLVYRGSVVMTPPVVLDPTALSDVWATRLRRWVQSDERFSVLGTIPWSVHAPMPEFTERYLETYPCIVGEQWSGTQCLQCAPGRHRSVYDKECRPCVLGTLHFASQPGLAECELCPQLGADCNSERPWETPTAQAGHYRLIKTDWRNTNISAIREMLSEKAAQLGVAAPPFFDFLRDDPVSIWAYIHELPPLSVANPLSDVRFNWSSALTYPRCKPSYLCLAGNTCAKNHQGVLCSSCVPGTSRRLLYVVINDALCVDCISVPLAYMQVIIVWCGMVLFSRLFAEIGRRTAKHHASISVAVMRIIVLHFACTGLARGTIQSAGISPSPDGISVMLEVLVGFVTDPYGIAGADCLREAQTPSEAIAQNLILQDILFIGGFVAISSWYHIRQAPARIQKHARKARKTGAAAVSKTMNTLASETQESQRLPKEEKRDKVRRKYEAIMLSNAITRNRRVSLNHGMAWLFVAMPSFLIAHLDAETCTPEFDGDERLLTKPAILCYSEEYRYLRSYAQVVTVFVLIAVPAGVAYVAWIHRELHCDVTTTLQWGTLFSGYRSNCKMYAMLYIAKFFCLAMSRFTSSLPLRVMLSFLTVAVAAIIEYLGEPFQTFDYFALHKLEMCSNVLLLVSILVVGLETLATEPGADALIIYLSRQIGDVSDQFLSVLTFIFVLLGAWCMVYNKLFVALAIARDSKIDSETDWRRRPWYTRLVCMVGLLPPPQAMNTMIAQVKHAGLRQDSEHMSSGFQISYIDSSHLNPFEVAFWLNGLEAVLDEVLRVRKVFSIGLLMTLVDEAYERAVHGRTAFMEVLKHRGHFWLRKTRMERRRNTLDLLTVEGLPSMSSTGSLHGSISGNVGHMTSLGTANEFGSRTSTDDDVHAGGRRMGRSETIMAEQRRHVNFSMTVVELNRAMVDLQADIILSEPSLQRKLGVRSQGDIVRTTVDNKFHGFLDMHQHLKLEKRPGATVQVTLAGVVLEQLIARPQLVESLESSFGFSISRELPEVVEAHRVHIIGIKKDQDSNTVVTVVVNVAHESDAPALLRRLEDHARNNLLQPTMLLHLPIAVVKLSSERVRMGLMTVTGNTVATEAEVEVNENEEDSDFSSERQVQHGKSGEVVTDEAKELLDNESFLKEMMYRKEMEIRALQNALRDAEILALNRLRARRDLELQHAHSAAAPPRSQLGDALDFCEIVMHFAAPIGSKATIAESFGQDSFRLHFREALVQEFLNMLVEPAQPELEIHLGVDEPTARVRGSASDLARLRAALDSGSYAGVRKLVVMDYTLDKVSEQLATDEVERSPMRAAPSPPTVPGPLLPKPKRKSRQTSSSRHVVESGARLPLAVAAARVVQQEKHQPPQPKEQLLQVSLQQAYHWRDLIREGRIFDADRLLRHEVVEVAQQRQIADVRWLYEASLAMLTDSHSWHVMRDGASVLRSRVANGVLKLCCSTKLYEFEGDALRACALMLEADMRPMRSKRMTATELMQANSTPEHALWRMENPQQKVSYLRCSAVDALDESSQSLWVFDRTLSEEDTLPKSNAGSPTPRRGAWGAYRIAPLQEESVRTTANRVGGLTFTFLSEATVSKEVEEAVSENPETLRTAMFRDSQRFLEAFRQALKLQRDEVDVRMVKSCRADLYAALKLRLRRSNDAGDDAESENIVTWLD